MQVRRPARGLAVLAVLTLAACAAPEPVALPAAAPVRAEAPPAQDPKVAENAAGLEARALLAQAETDIQRARAKRALWAKAWESLVLARNAAGGSDHAAVVRHARKASELAQLGLEQLAYPAVQ